MIYIVGAGPGEPELLTLKALRLIQEADVVLYDRLVNPEILNYTKPACKNIYVGKEDGQHLFNQDQINELLIFHSTQHKSVVRLKGGDPYIFGRGGEEELYLIARGAPFEMVPGISSAVAVPAYAGIPVTHRGLACSFLVVTGHEAPDKVDGNDQMGFLSRHPYISFFNGCR